MRRRPLSRRDFLASIGAASLAALVPPVPSSGQQLPRVGLGSWITFNVGDDVAARDECTEVMRAFFAGGGRHIDSSPMYGSSQAVIGYGLARLGRPKELFAADKVWIGSGDAGPGQIEESRRHWGVERFDLLQVHNLMAWQEHLTTLREMKAAGRLRFVGVTTSHGRRHDELERILRGEQLDFVQLSYSAATRDVEARLTRFFEALDNVVLSVAADVQFVDMRYTNGFAVGWKLQRAAQAAPEEDLPRTEQLPRA